ncbi:hypothetical protein PIB30_065650 [Stylosanthes scabra]|uniref:Uncharacterized protein n=1 Tax=Stylosanthes scabra TaxID=79078 RepID=A0ABU6TMP0_9FABA|nr:hypothetical protein [Stylosanthes scabra]
MKKRFLRRSISSSSAIRRASRSGIDKGGSLVLTEVMKGCFFSGYLVCICCKLNWNLVFIKMVLKLLTTYCLNDLIDSCGLGLMISTMDEPKAL